MSKPTAVAFRLRCLSVAVPLLAAAALAVGLPLASDFMARQRADARVVELSGKQRMLSQRVAKSAVALQSAEGGRDQERWRSELAETVGEWREGVNELSGGGRDSVVAGQNSDDVAARFADLRPHFEAMTAAADRLVAADAVDERDVTYILTHEGPFLTKMDAIVQAYTAEGRTRADKMQTLCAVLAVGLIVLPLLAVVLVSEPAIRSIRRLVSDRDLTAVRLRQSQAIAEQVEQLTEEVERKRAEEAQLRQSREALGLVAEIAEHVQHPLLRTDRLGRVQWVNPAFETVTRRTLADVAGEDALSVILSPKASPQKVAKLRKGVSVGGGARQEVRVERGGGSEAWAKVEIAPYRGDAPDEHGFVISMVDTTARRSRLQRTQAELATALEKSESQARFLGYMSHEIRTPLTAVLGYAELVRTGEMTPEELEEALENIGRSGKLLLELVNNILDYQKIDLDTEVVTDDADVRTLLDGVARAFRGVADKKNVRVDCRVADAVPESLPLDTMKVRQVLSNLVGNAVKFTEKGDVTLHAELAREDGGAELRLAVTDTGVGIQPDRLAAVFEPFQQEDGRTSQKFGGTGLGLSICRMLVGRLGGAIEAHSTPGVGSRFDVRLPVADDYHAASEDADEPAGGAKPPKTDGLDEPPSGSSRMLTSTKLQGLHVLLADDWEVNREMIRLVLRRAGAEVTCACDGREAVDLAMKVKPDVILMDMQMPVLDGPEAIAELQSLGCESPVVAVTADALEGDRERCLALGCVDYLPKPVDFRELKRAVLRATLVGQTSAADYAAGMEAARGVFAGEMAQALSDASDALDGADFDAVARLMHGLAGAAAMVGESEWVRPLREAEQAAREGDGPSARLVVDGLTRLSTGEGPAPAMTPATA